MENKLKYFRLVLKGFLDEISFLEGFKKQLSTVSAAELGEATVRTQWAMDWTELNYLQYLACTWGAWSEEKLPSDKFKALLQSIPIEEVNKQSIKGTGTYREQGRNLLQFLATRGKTAYVSLLLQQGADPEAVTEENPDIPLRCAWLNDHVAVMGLLAEVSEVSREIRSSSTWQLVEQEQGWQKEVLEKLNKQAELLALVAKAVGVKVEG